MFGGDSAQDESILRLAQAELAAFLEGTRTTLGCKCPSLPGTTWIETMLSLEWPHNGYQKFFRLVTIAAFARIVPHHSGTKAPLPTVHPRSFMEGDNYEHERPLTSV